MMSWAFVSIVFHLISKNKPEMFYHLRPAPRVCGEKKGTQNHIKVMFRFTPARMHYIQMLFLAQSLDRRPRFCYRDPHQYLRKWGLFGDSPQAPHMNVAVSRDGGNIMPPPHLDQPSGLSLSTILLDLGIIWSERRRCISMNDELQGRCCLCGKEVPIAVYVGDCCGVCPGCLKHWPLE